MALLLYIEMRHYMSQPRRHGDFLRLLNLSMTLPARHTKAIETARKWQHATGQALPPAP
jgi:hypothetical protein